MSVLTFRNVDYYNVIDGFVVFKNRKDNRTKRFAVSNTEIEEEEGDNH